MNVLRENLLALLTQECDHIYQSLNRFCRWQEHGVAVDSDQADQEDDGEGDHGSPVEDPGIDGGNGRHDCSDVTGTCLLAGRDDIFMAINK